MTDRPFNDMTAVVTGAGGTLCSAVAKDLARLGARVALLGRSMEPLEKVAAEIRAAGGAALPVSADVTREETVSAAAEVVARELGPCRLLVNGAGGNQPTAVTSVNQFTPDELREDRPEGLRGFFNVDLDRFGDVILTNTMGTVIPSRAFGRHMAQNGGGAIVNMASMNSYRPLTRNAAYGMAKAGIVNLTQWLAAYLAPAGIRVNAVAPGFFPNDRSRKILLDASQADGLTDRGRQVIAHTPQRRFGEADELAGAVAWLLDDARAGFVTGVTIPVDGGFMSTAGV